MHSHFLEVKQALVDTYREWYKKRWIPLDVCENDWEHCKRATQACISHLIWSPERISDRKWFPLMWFWHDWVEWDIPDYTPSCNISSEDKKRLEWESLGRLRRKLWSKYSPVLDKAQEYLDWLTGDSEEMFYIDKSLAWIWGLEYERQWFEWMEDFHPYALDKLSWDDFHTRVYQILLEREFQSIDFFTQYFLLLRLSWDRNSFRREMQCIS